MPERIPLTRDDAERGVPPVPFAAAEWEALHRASATYAPLRRAWDGAAVVEEPATPLWFRIAADPEAQRQLVEMLRRAHERGMRLPNA